MDESEQTSSPNPKYVPFYWTCPWCHITEMDKAGRYIAGKVYHFSCWDEKVELLHQRREEDGE